MSFLGKSYIAEATDNQNLSSGDSLLPGMTITPPAGNYLVFLSCSVEGTAGSAFNDIVIRVGGVFVGASRRNFTTSTLGDNQASVTTMARVTVDGTQAIEGYGASDLAALSFVSFRQLLVVQSG